MTGGLKRVVGHLMLKTCFSHIISKIAQGAVGETQVNWEK